MCYMDYLITDYGSTERHSCCEGVSCCRQYIFLNFKFNIFSFSFPDRPNIKVTEKDKYKRTCVAALFGTCHP